MAQMESFRKIKTSESPQTPRARSSPTFEQLLTADASKWPPTNSPMHEDNHHNSKKSVISKVKERAKKLRNSIGKKKHGHENCSSPCSNASHENCESPGSTLSLDDDEEYEDGEGNEDPEYLGAPMYESELAPESYKENARQHPRADPVVSENHVLASSINRQHDQQPETEDKQIPISPSKAGTFTGSVSQKLAPAYNAVSDATYSIASRIGLTNSSPRAQEDRLGAESTHHPGRVVAGNVSDQNNTGTGNQTYDKGVSVKEYFMNKLEPGEDEKALSQAITEAISPKKPHAERGVVEKVREAVTSLLRTEETSQSATRVAHSPSPIPVSTNAYPVYEEEETHGRILQTN